MCTIMILKSGRTIAAIKEFKEYFNVDPAKYKWEDDECFDELTDDTCLCSINLKKFIEVNNLNFKYESDEFWEF